jgi:diguanylate cyclase (GGDEF)-like protein
VAELNERQFETTGSLDIDLKDALERCDKDPIHQTAFIQPHGTFLDVYPTSLEIRSAAENVEQYFEHDAASLIGETLDACYPFSDLDRLQYHLQNRFPERKTFSLDLNGTRYNVSLFPVDDRAGIEIEQRGTNDEPGDLLITNLTDQLDQLRNQNDRTSLFNRTLEQVASFTNYDRLMVYSFDEEGHGSVVAEQKNDALQSFMGLQFPASDIPEPARQIYRKNTIRIIPNVEYDPVPILGPDGQRRRDEMDLTYSDLRSVPDIHRQYMMNMGVQGSLSLSLMVDDELWGMIACHSMSPHYIDSAQKSACKQIARTAAQQIQELITRDRELQYKKISDIRKHVDETITSHSQLFRGLEQSSKSLLTLMDASVFYLQMEGESYGITNDDGAVPHAKQLIGGIKDHLVEEKTCTVRSIKNEWDKEWSHSPRISGFHARRLAYSSDSFCVWFRPEQRETIDWGGDPRNPVEVTQDGELSPRSSFDTWTQVVSGTCRRWTDLDRLTAEEISRHFKEMEIELQKSLLEETNRRIESQNQTLEETKQRLETINKEKEELLEQVQKMARTDDLTGLLNRDELEQQLLEEFERVQRYDQDLSVVFIDLDHFKPVNDKYGHQVGDDVLAVTGEKLRSVSRKTDTVGRYGGEEFLAVLPETDIEHAKTFAERFMNDLRNHTFQADGTTFQLTCSAGISEYRPSDGAPESIVNRADDALYRAKNSGRDTVCIAGETDEQSNQTGS